MRPGGPPFLRGPSAVPARGQLVHGPVRLRQPKPSAFSHHLLCCCAAVQAAVALTFLRMNWREQSNIEKVRPQLAKLPPNRGLSRRRLCMGWHGTSSFCYSTSGRHQEGARRTALEEVGVGEMQRQQLLEAAAEVGEELL